MRKSNPLLSVPFCRGVLLSEQVIAQHLPPDLSNQGGAHYIISEAIAAPLGLRDAGDPVIVHGVFSHKPRGRRGASRTTDLAAGIEIKEEIGQCSPLPSRIGVGQEEGRAEQELEGAGVGRREGRALLLCLDLGNCRDNVSLGEASWSQQAEFSQSRLMASKYSLIARFSSSVISFPSTSRRVVRGRALRMPRSMCKRLAIT